MDEIDSNSFARMLKPIIPYPPPPSNPFLQVSHCGLHNFLFHILSLQQLGEVGYIVNVCDWLKASHLLSWQVRTQTKVCLFQTYYSN